MSNEQILQTIVIDRLSGTQPFLQLANEIERLIRCGALTSRLPRIRDFASLLHVDKGIVERAIRELKKRKLVRAVKGIGTSVIDAEHRDPSLCGFLQNMTKALRRISDRQEAEEVRTLIRMAFESVFSQPLVTRRPDDAHDRRGTNRRSFQPLKIGNNDPHADDYRTIRAIIADAVIDGLLEAEIRTGIRTAFGIVYIERSAEAAS
jgi:DNA-binding transcriptional regulator YhcF (GntR family)